MLTNARGEVRPYLCKGWQLELLLFPNVLHSALTVLSYCTKVIRLRAQVLKEASRQLDLEQKRLTSFNHAEFE